MRDIKISRRNSSVRNRAAVHDKATVKQLFRILMNIATVLSLVLCVETAVLSMRSYSVKDRARWISPRQVTALWLERGRFVAVWTHVSDENGGLFPDPPGFYYDAVPATNEPTSDWMLSRNARRFAGVIYQPDTLIDSHFGTVFYRLWSIPLWLASLVLAIMPFLRWRGRMRRLRQAASNH